MPMLEFTLIDGAPIWIDPDKVCSEAPSVSGLGPKELEPASTSVSIAIAVGWSKNQSGTSLLKSCRPRRASRSSSGLPAPTRCSETI
jgi:hypothetical protein